MNTITGMTNNTLSLFTNFLNAKTGTILSVAAAMAIGGSFKDLVTSIVNNFLQPLIIKLILLTNLTKLTNINSLFSAKNNILNFSNIIVSILSFIFIVATVYAMVTLINHMAAGNKDEVKEE